MNLDAQAVPPLSAFQSGFTPTQPPNPSTYNTTTSTTIYDSLGNSHILTSYFVKGHALNTWHVHVGIDGMDVTPTAPTPPVGVPPVSYPLGVQAAPYTIVFNSSGAYVPNNPVSNATYYGPGPVTSTAPALSNSGTLSQLTLNDLIINGTPINGTSITSDIVSTTDNSASAIAIAATINQGRQSHGVQATVNPCVLNLGAATIGDLAVGDFTINGVSINGPVANQAALLNLINLSTPSTGVVATAPAGDIILTASDGRNIQVVTDGTQASGANFANFNLNGGAALDQVQRGTVSLATSNNEAIIISGNAPNHAGFVSGPQAGIVQSNSDLINISDWIPVGGATGPQQLGLDFNASTQYGAPFSVLGLSQNGYSTGRISGVDIDAGGVILAKYSNGQSIALGQVALANFGNIQGLSPVGNTSWVETFASGSALVGAPGSASLGLVQSGALEDSNVELTDQLVALIVAQRNFQANAQTIRTADAVTQTIINIR
jgi:flagellar hook protein FlgE